MTVTALAGMPWVPIGAAHKQGVPLVANLVDVTCDAAKEAAIMIGYIFTDDGASHTIDTTGSSSLGWRSGTSTFANAGTTVKVGLAAVDTASGPPGRAVNVADVITFDVSASFTGGGGGITSAAWQTSVPTAGTKTIANGALVAFAVQMTALGGVDTVLVSAAGYGTSTSIPAVTSFTGGAYADAVRGPNCVITFSDGHLGFFYGGHVASVGTTAQSYNSGSSPNEYGNLLKFPFPVQIYGAYVGMSVAGDTDIVLYSDPLGTPAAQKTVSVDLNTVGGTGNSRWLSVLFSSPYSLAANTACAIIAKPTSVTNVSMSYKTLFAASHQASDNCGTDGYAVNRASGAFAAQNSNKDRFAIGLLVGAFDNGVSASSSPVGQQLGM